MPSLDPTFRKLLEHKVPDARQIAEEAARAILDTLAVNRPEPYPAMTPEQRRLRNTLRAKARQLGNGSQTEGFEPLVEELAYYQWHRMVFARFLAENNLLMHPSGVPVTLQECGEMAYDEGEMDAWTLAARYASLMLPGIFRQDDPENQVRLAPEGQQKLEALLNSVPSPVFLADDSLGWMYQFWQSRKKEEINKSERKIGGADIAPVTQLFTEDYMVRFLLENTLGAWWASRHPDSPLIKEWQYLRFKEDGTPAAGSFPGWPERASEMTVMDPCCGSGHFLIAGFEMLVRMRMEEEGLSVDEAGNAVLSKNLFGLELDPRCTQIAVFALVLAAWKSGGYRHLPMPNIACAGIPVQGQLETWLKLAGEDSRLRAGLERLYGLFKNAPDLGSLINPADLPAADRMFVSDYELVAPVLEQALAKEHSASDPVAQIFGASAEDVARAAKLLSGKYTLVITNVPYLGYKKQGDFLKDFIEEYYSKQKMDLATVFIERCKMFCHPSGSFAIVSPQNWLFLGSYKKMRESIIQEQAWNMLVSLGGGKEAFDIGPGNITSICMFIITNRAPSKSNSFSGIDASIRKTIKEKIGVLQTEVISIVRQSSLMDNPDYRISFTATSGIGLLEKFAIAPRGIVSGDTEYWTKFFWEFSKLSFGWKPLQVTVERTQNYGGRTSVINWQIKGKGMLRPGIGNLAYGHNGIVVNRMADLNCTLFTGELYDQSVAVIVPKKGEHLNAIWQFCKSDEYRLSVRNIDKKLGVTPATLLKVPFDLERWQKVAEAAGPLPEPYSDDPTQWLFKGYPCGSESPLQVAVARLLGSRWPQQNSDNLNEFIDEDGILCLPIVAGEAPLAERLRNLLAAAYGNEWSGAKQTELLAAVGYTGKDLTEWLRDGFFEQHCRLFHNRPFLWHIWDGRKDGFSALVNYHKLTTANLDRLIYTYLGDWINFQRARRDHGEPGADGRLVAALELQKKLKLIREGEAGPAEKKPEERTGYDIYVRWKSLAEQPIGWDPDLNDGVRLNIRPFVTARVLRSKFTIHWNKDRGKNPDGSERLNDLHFTIAEKRADR